MPMGSLEDAVMEVLWQDTGWMTPGEVLGRLETERPLAITTVTTVLVRLFEKTRLERRKDGRAYAYHPTSSRAEWTASRMDDALDSVGDRRAALTHFLERLDDDDRTQLRRMLSKDRR
jgi:predicted transcriptional regulator